MPRQAPDLQSLRAILFDLDGTLYVQKPVRRGMALELLSYPVISGRPIRGLRTIRILRAYRALHEELREAPTRHLGRVQLERAAARAGVPLEEAERTVHEWMIRRPLPRLMRAKREGLDAFLLAAKQRGLELGVYSDYPVEEKLRGLGVREHFSWVGSSADERIDELKPSPKGFATAASEWGIAPEQVLYVGDRAEVDRAGAESAGMACVLMGADQPSPSARDFKELSRVLGLA